MISTKKTRKWILKIKLSLSAHIYEIKFEMLDSHDEIVLS